jgi:Tfp pilus assembly protein PilX
MIPKPIANGIAPKKGNAMKRLNHKGDTQRGVALIIALLTLLLLSVLAAAILFLTQTEVWATYNYRRDAQSRYLAEAGAQRAADWLSNTYVKPAAPPWDATREPVQWNGANVVLAGITGHATNYPDATTQATYSNALSNQQVTIGGVTGTYSADATLVTFPSGGSMVEAWQITSQGSIPGVQASTVEVKVTIEQRSQPLLSFAVFGTGSSCGDLTLSGGAYSDSFDSSQGTYASTKLDSDGNVGSNGNVTLSGSTTDVNGTISVLQPNVGTCSAANDITNSAGPGAYQGITQLLNPLVFPDPPAISPAPPTTNQNYTANTTLPPGDYGNVNMSGGKTLTLSPGTYNLNSLVLSGGSQLQISPPGQVIINIAGTGTSTPVNLSGGTITNTTGVPLNMQINYAGTQPIDLSGGSGCYAVVYAPNSPISISGGSDWYGAILGQSFTDSGGTAIHYDRALLNQFLQTGPFRTTSYSRSKF